MRSSRTRSPSETGQRARAGIEALGSAAPHPNNHRAGMVMSDKQVSQALFDLEKDESRWRRTHHTAAHAVVRWLPPVAFGAERASDCSSLRSLPLVGRLSADRHILQDLHGTNQRSNRLHISGRARWCFDLASSMHSAGVAAAERPIQRGRRETPQPGIPVCAVLD